MIQQTRKQLLKSLNTQFISTLHPDRVWERCTPQGTHWRDLCYNIGSGSHNHENSPFSIACLCTIVIVDPDLRSSPLYHGAVHRRGCGLPCAGAPDLHSHYAREYTQHAARTGIRLSVRTAYHLPEQVSFASLRGSFIRWVLFTPI